MRKSLLIVLALAAIAGGVVAQRWTHQAKKAELDAAIVFPDLEGKPHDLREWAGKILVVNFWATWCPPCIEEMPEFAKLQTELGDKGVQFIGILTDDEADAAREFLAKWPVNYPILDGTIGGRQWSAAIGNTSEVLPFSAVFDADGRLVHGEAGRFTRDEVLAKVSPLIQ